MNGQRLDKLSIRLFCAVFFIKILLELTATCSAQGLFPGAFTNYTNWGAFHRYSENALIPASCFMLLIGIYLRGLLFPLQSWSYYLVALLAIWVTNFNGPLTHGSHGIIQVHLFICFITASKSRAELNSTKIIYLIHLAFLYFFSFYHRSLELWLYQDEHLQFLAHPLYHTLDLTTIRDYKPLFALTGRAFFLLEAMAPVLLLPLVMSKKWTRCLSYGILTGFITMHIGIIAFSKNLWWYSVFMIAQNIWALFILRNMSTRPTFMFNCRTVFVALLSIVTIFSNFLPLQTIKNHSTLQWFVFNSFLPRWSYLAPGVYRELHTLEITGYDLKSNRFGVDLSVLAARSDDLRKRILHSACEETSSKEITYRRVTTRLTSELKGYTRHEESRKVECQ